MNKSSGYTIRKANVSSDDEIQFIAKTDVTIPAMYDSDFEINEAVIQDRFKFLKAAKEEDFFEVAVNQKNEIVGFHLVKKVPHFKRFAGRIDTLWVSPDFRGLGIVKDLKNRAEVWAKQSDLDHLHTWVHVDNKKMIAINKEMGFEVAHYKFKKTKQKFATSVRFDAVIPSLHTDRLIIRPLNLNDAKNVQKLAGDQRIAMTTASIPHPYPDGLAEEWILSHKFQYEKKQAVNWAMALKETNQLIGVISLYINSQHNRAELGYWVGVDYWNKGYCSEAAKPVVNFAFEELNLNKVTSRYMESNGASGRVMEKAGLKKEGVLVQDYIRNGEYINMVVYGLIRDDWKA